MAGLIFSRAGVCALGDVNADPNVPGHATTKGAWLKEEAYATQFPGDLFYPLALEVFGALTIYLIVSFRLAQFSFFC